MHSTRPPWAVATGDMATVIDAVTALSAPQARSAYESMGGLMHTLLPTIGISDVTQFNRATASRLRARTDGTTGTGLAWSGIKLASAPSPHSDAPALFASTGATRSASDAASRNVWLSGYGLDGDLDGDASSGAYDYRISGLIIGVDTDIDRRWTAGLSAAYSDWRVRNDGRGDRSDVKAYRIGAYGRFTDGPIRVDGVVGYGNVDYETDRRIVFGTINRTAHGRLQRRPVHRQPGRALPHRARALRHRAVRRASIRARIAGRLRRGRRGLDQSGRRGPERSNQHAARSVRASIVLSIPPAAKDWWKFERATAASFPVCLASTRPSSVIRREPASAFSPRTSIVTAGWPARACRSRRRRI